jgi:hypothetical protein
MRAMEITDMLGNRVEVRMVMIQIKDWGAVSQERKGAILWTVGECQNISDYGRYAS